MAVRQIVCSGPLVRAVSMLSYNKNPCQSHIDFPPATCPENHPNNRQAHINRVRLAIASKATPRTRWMSKLGIRPVSPA